MRLGQEPQQSIRGEIQRTDALTQMALISQLKKSDQNGRPQIAMTDMPEKTVEETVPKEVAATVCESEEKLCTQEIGTTECVFNVSVNSC